jgi:stage II sporulation protein AA (anti-sigma F factor antagonist)
MSALRLEHREGVPVARLHGDIDAANAEQVAGELVQAGADTVHLVVDLGDVRYLDSAAIDMLFRLGERLQQRRGALCLVIPTASNLGRLVDIVGLPAVTPVCASVEQALTACAGDGAGP